jgi:hypothetical protein
MKAAVSGAAASSSRLQDAALTLMAEKLDGMGNNFNRVMLKMDQLITVLAKCKGQELDPNIPTNGTEARSDHTSVSYGKKTQAEEFNEEEEDEPISKISFKKTKKMHYYENEED